MRAEPRCSIDFDEEVYLYRRPRVLSCPTARDVPESTAYTVSG